METQKEIALRNNKKLIGTTTRVLIEGLNDHNGFLKGRTPSQAPEIDGVTYLTKGQADPGGIFDVIITDVSEYDLMGEIIIK